MRLLIVTLDNYPHIGGKATHIKSLVDGLKSEEIDTNIFSRNEIDNIFYKCIKFILQPIKLISIKKYLYIRKKLEFILFKNKLKLHLNRNKYDCISSQDALSCTAVGRINCKTPITLTMHTYFGIEYTLDNNYFNESDKLYKKLLKLEEESLSYTKHVVAVDKRIKEHVITTIKNKYTKSLNEYHLKVISNFTNTEEFKEINKSIAKLNLNHNENADEFIVICVRRLVEKNGVIYAVKAMKEIVGKYNVKLYIIGDGPEREKIETFIRKNNLENSVVLVGSIDNSKLLNWYAISDCVLVPSITVNGLQEATSISAIEAMACAKLTIASDIGGIKELIKDGQTGFLVPEKNHHEIANCIINSINNKQYSILIGRNSREYILKEHSHITVAKKYADIFRMSKIN